MEYDVIISKLNKGEKLYHYTSATGLMGVCNGEFWVTEKSFLNDNMEFAIASEAFSELLTEKIQDEQSRNHFKEAIMKEMQLYNLLGCSNNEESSEGWYVLSFCTEKDSILMWSQYSEFVGYCMEFDYERFIDSLKQYIIQWHGKVIYNRNEQKDYIERTIQKLILEEPKYYSGIHSWKDLVAEVNKNNKEIISFIATILAVYSMFFKKSCFEGEKEYRIVFACTHNGPIGEKTKLQENQFFRVKEEVLIPFIKREFDVSQSLESILVGPKNNSDLAVKGLQYFFRNKKMNVEIDKSKIPLRY